MLFLGGNAIPNKYLGLSYNVPKVTSTQMLNRIIIMMAPVMTELPSRCLRFQFLQTVARL